MVYFATVLVAAAKRIDSAINRDKYQEKERKEMQRRSRLTAQERRREDMNTLYLRMR